MLLANVWARAGVVGLGIVLLGFAAKTYYQKASVSEAVIQSAEVENRLSKSVDALAEHLSAQKERKLPESVGWTPRELPCGLSVEVPRTEASHPTWKAVGIDLSKATFFQYLFRTDGSKFELLARADNDCDGRIDEGFVEQGQQQM